MPISVFLDPSQMPARTQEQQVFDNFMAQFMQNLPTFAAQINSTEAGMNAVAAGGAYAIPYAVDFSSTADGDPGNGKLRFNSATQSAATALYLDVLGFDTADYTGLIDTFDMSNSTIKGTLRLVKLGDPKKFLAFLVMARTTATGYRKLSVTPSVASAANPFAAGDVVLALFTPAGERGLEGKTGYQLFAESAVTTPVAAISYPNLFTSDYDKYVIEVQNLVPAGSAVDFTLNMVIGGVVLNSSNTYSMIGATGSGATPSSIPLGAGVNGTINNAGGVTMTIEIRNANSAGIKTISVRGSYQVAAGSIGQVRTDASCVGDGKATGFVITPSTGNINAGLVRVFGVKNRIG